MAELKEMFDMVTNKVEPDLDSWREQEERQRNRGRGRRVTAFAVAAAIVAVMIGAVAMLRSQPAAKEPGASTAPPLVGTTSLVAYDAASGTATPFLSDVDAGRAAVSPEGSQIAFLRTVKGHPQIFVAYIDGTGATQVTGLPGQPGCKCGAFEPAWSPDGTEIAFSGSNEAGIRGMYLLTLATSEVRPLTHPSGDAYQTSPTWSPDGTAIAYAEGSWQTEPAGSGRIEYLPVRSADTISSTLVTKLGATAPTMSPLGGEFVFAANVGDGTALFLAKTDGSEPTSLTQGTTDEAPAYSPDGTQIAFVRGSDIAILTIATGEVRTLGPGGDPAWSADGTTIYAWQAS